MTIAYKSLTFRKLLYSFRNVVVVTIVYALEMLIWAVLNKYGIGDNNWMKWRICMLGCVSIIYYTGLVFASTDNIWHPATGALIAWPFIFVGIILWFFIQNSLFLTPFEWFYSGVVASFACQILFTTLICSRN